MYVTTDPGLPILTTPQTGASSAASGEGAGIARADLLRWQHHLKLSSGEYLLVEALLWYIWERGERPWVGLETLAKITGMSKRQAMRNAQTLRRKGVLDWEERPNASRLWKLGGLRQQIASLQAQPPCPICRKLSGKTPDQGGVTYCHPPLARGDIMSPVGGDIMSPDRSSVIDLVPEPEIETALETEPMEQPTNRAPSTSIPPLEEVPQVKDPQTQTLSFALSLCSEEERELISRLRGCEDWVPDDKQDADFAARILRDWPNPRWVLQKAEEFRLYQNGERAKRRSGKKSANVWEGLALAFRKALPRYHAWEERDRKADEARAKQAGEAAPRYDRYESRKTGPPPPTEEQKAEQRRMQQVYREYARAPRQKIETTPEMDAILESILQAQKGKAKVVHGK